MGVIAKYKFNQNVYADFIPEFNSEFTDYTITDETDIDGYTIRTIESDSLPQRIKFGETANSYVEKGVQSLIEILFVDIHNGMTNLNGFLANARNLITVNTDGWDTSEIVTMQQMFYNCPSLTSLNVSNFNTEKVAIMNNMFANCSKLTSLDVSNFNTSQVNNMSDMFKDCSKLTSLDVSNFNTEKVSNMGSMFTNCSSLTSLNLSNFNTEKVTSMGNMFQNCSSLTSLNISNFNTSQVTSMLSMFYNCSSLISLDVSNFNTEKVSNMGSMFTNCSSLTSLNLSNFNTEKVTSMGNMFQNCSSLTSLNISNFNTSQVTSMLNMFYNCSSLISLDVSNFNTSNVINMQYMFYKCKSLTSLDLSSFSIEKATTVNGMFRDCFKLTTLDISNFKVVNNPNKGYFMTGSTKIKNIAMIYCSAETINYFLSELLATPKTIYYHDANLSDLTVQDNITYQYYDKSTVTLPYELNKLPNGVADYIDVVNGVYVQRVGKQVLDSTWNWSKAFEYDTRIDFRCGLANLVNQNGANGLCDKLHYNTDNNLEKECAMLFAHANVSQWIIVINKSRLTTNDVEGFKTWLANNPTTVLYELAIPIYTPLTDEEKASLPLSAYSNGYIQLSSDELRPSKFEFRAKSSNRLQLDMLETGHYYLNAPTGNVKLGDVDIDVTEMPCLIKVDNASNKRLVVNGHFPTYNINDDSFAIFDKRLEPGTSELVNSVGMAITKYFDIGEIGSTSKYYIECTNGKLDNTYIATYDENYTLVNTHWIASGSSTILTKQTNEKYIRLSYSRNESRILKCSPVTVLSKLPSHRIPTTFTQGMKSSVDFGYWQGVKEAKALYVRTINPTDWGEISRINFRNGIELNRISGTYAKKTTIVEDELDVSTGKYTKRIGKYVIDGTVDPYKELEFNHETNMEKVVFLGITTGIKPKVRWNYTESLINTASLKFNISYSLDEPHIFIGSKGNINLYVKAGTFGALTLENVKKYFSENPMIVYYELETPEITYLDLERNELRTASNSTNLQAQSPDSSIYLKPQVKPSPLSYPTTLSPSTQYTVFHNRKNYDGSVKTPMINLGGTEVAATGSRTVVTTPGTLVHNELQFIGGENTVEQVMVLHGDWTKEGKTVDYFEGLQSSVIGDKTLENLVGDTVEIWSSSVTNSTNGGAVDYVSMDDIVAGNGNRPKLPEIQASGALQTYGLTLNNLLSSNPNYTCSEGSKETEEYFEKTFSVGQTYVQALIMFNLSQPLVPDKEYALIVPFVYGNNINSIIRDIDNRTNLTPMERITSNVIRFTPTSQTTRLGYYNSPLDYTELKQEWVARMPKKLIIVEYQQGMENWNIPYFEGMRSVENPVYHSVGKNLFNIHNHAAFTNGNTISGITVTTNANGEAIFNGTAPNDQAVYFIADGIGEPILERGKTYFVSDCACQVWRKDGTKTWANKITFDDTIDRIKPYIEILKGETVTNMVKRIQIEQGNHATEYEPYKENILSTAQGTVLRGVGSYKDMMGWNDGIIRRNCIEFTITGEEGYTITGITENTNTISCGIPWETLGLENKIPTNDNVNMPICDKIPTMGGNEDTPHIRQDGGQPYSGALAIWFDKTKFSTYTSQGVNDYIKSIGGLTIVAPLINTGYEGVTFTNDYSNVDEEYQVGKPLIFNHGTLYTTTDTHPSTFLDFSLKTTNRYTVKDFDKLKYTVLTEQPFYLNGVDYPASSTGMTIIDVTGIADSSIYSDDAMVTVVQDDGNYYADGVLTQFKGERTFTKEFIRTGNDTYSTGMTLLEPLELCSESTLGVQDSYNPITGQLTKNLKSMKITKEEIINSNVSISSTSNNLGGYTFVLTIGVPDLEIPTNHDANYINTKYGATRVSIASYSVGKLFLYFHYDTTYGVMTLDDFKALVTEDIYFIHQLKTPQIIQATPTSTYISTRPENGNIIAQDTQIQVEYLNYDNEQSIISPRMLGDGDEIRWEQGSQCYVYENDNEYIPLTEYNELFGANLQAQEYTQYAESVDGADIEVGVALKEKAVYEQTYVKYEDNIVYPTTRENIDETNGVEVDYICGATWQNPNDLSDIRHLGELREDGQYDVSIRHSGDDEIRLLEGTTHLSLDYDKLPSSEFELTFFNSGGVEVGKYGDTTHVLEDCVENSKLASCTVYGETLTNLMTAYKEESLLCYYYVGTDPDVANVSMLKPNTLYTLIYKAKYQESGNTDSIVIRCSTSHSTGDSQVKYTTTYAEYKCKFITPDIIDGFVLGSSGHYFHVKECILLEGDWTNVNIPYFEGISSTVVNGFSSCGKNLCTNINNKNTDIIETNGAEYENKLSVTSDYIKVKKGKTYVGSNKELGESDVRLRCYDINKKYIGSTITSNTEYIRLRQLLSQETDANTVFFQLEEGSVATEFEPYKSTNYTLPTPITLRKVGDVCDTFDVVSGVETRNVTELTFNGSENWDAIFNSSSSVFKLTLPSIKANPPLLIKNGLVDGIISIAFENNVLVIQTTANFASISVNVFKNKLKDNPITIYAQPANPQTIQHTLIPSTTQTTQEPTFILPQPLRSVPNGICDRLYWDENKGHYCIEKRIEVLEINGTFNWSQEHLNSTHIGVYSYDIKTNTYSPYYSSLSSYFKCYPSTGHNSNDGREKITYAGNGGIKVFIANDKLTEATPTGVKQWFTENPTTYYRAQEKPEIIDLPYLDKKVELLTQPDIYPIGYKAVHEKANPEIGLTIPYKVLNMPTQPTNLNFVMDIADYVLTWDDVKEARQYNIILNDEVIATVKEPQYNTGEEMYGYILVEANNEIGDNLSEELYIKTVPNAPAQLTVAHNPLTDHYDFEISFVDTSDIADYYTVMYKVDGGEWVINTIQNSELTTGEKHLWSFSIYEINESIEVWATATNDVGTNDILPTAIYYMSPTPQWTYRINSKDVFLRWLDESPYDTKYKLRYSYKSNGQLQYAYFEGDTAEIGKLYEAVLPLAEDDEVTLALCIVSEKENLYCKPVKASKPLDPNIVPPMNFNYHWLARGLIEFYWEDQYDVDVEYEYILESMKANETLWTQITEIIPSEDVEGIGTVYRVEYQLEDLEQIRMKVRMKWAMNETEWTETLTTVFIPVEGNPPTYIRRTQTAEGLLIEWEAQAYIDSYHIYVIDNETGEELQHLETQDNSILVDLDYSNSIEIAIYEISRFSGGIESDPTDPMVFTPTMFATDIDQRIYQPCAEKYPIEVSTVQKATKQAYVIHDVTYTPNVETEHEIGVSVATPFTISYHPMMVDVHQAGSRSEATINAHIKTLNTRNEDLIRVMTFERTQETYDMNFTVYTPSVASYPINLEISKVRIVCLGDSLTSGHPFYWAETGTGMIEASYPYQLSRRLKNQYEVINSGYGSDTTDRCLARFDRDVLRYQPQYCIFQCGTNDLYWAMAESLNNQEALDMKMQVVRENTMEVVKRCWDNGIIPIIGTLIPRTGATGIYKTALFEHNEWIISWCNQQSAEGREIFYVDFFNAGKDVVPPTPLEDPNNPGAINGLVAH